MSIAKALRIFLKELIVNFDIMIFREGKRAAERAIELQQQKDLVDFEVRELQSQIESEE